MLCSGFEPGATGWWAQTIPLYYGGNFTEIILQCIFRILKINSTNDWQLKCVIYYTTIRTADLLKQPIDPSSHIGSSLSPRDISFIEIRFILLEN